MTIVENRTQKAAEKQTDKQTDKQTEVWTVKDVLAWTSKRFSNAGIETALLDSQLLLGSVLNLDKVRLYMHYERPLTLEERSQVRLLIQRRLAGEPVAYLLGRKYWHTLDLLVDSRVLIPRPETETLLDFVLVCWEKNVKTPRFIVDLCTGSGCLAIALAKKFPEAKVIGVDCSEDALDVARENAILNSSENVDFRKGDVFDTTLMQKLVSEFGEIDILVANPPYVTHSEWQNCAATVRDFEPQLALVSENEGLAHGSAIVRALSTDTMSKNSVFAMELGTGAPHRIVNAVGLADSASWNEFSFHLPIWEIPRECWFGLRDLESRARFLCRVSGLQSRCFEPVSDCDSSLDEA